MTKQISNPTWEATVYWLPTFLLRRKLLVLLVISGVKRLSYIDSPERSEWHVAKPLFLSNRKVLKRAKSQHKNRGVKNMPQKIYILKINVQIFFR